MSLQALLTVFALLCAGALLAAEAPVNAALSRTLGDPLLAACISFGVGFMVLLSASLLKGGWPSGRALFTVPAWAWLGGFLGAIYVTVTIWGVPRLGVLTTVAALVLGQLLAALVLDAIGAFGLPVQAITLSRMLAIVLVVAGLVLSRQG